MAWKQLFYKVPYTNNSGYKWFSVLITDTSSTGFLYSRADISIPTLIDGVSAIVGFDPFVLMRPIICSMDTNDAETYHSVKWLKQLVPLAEIPAWDSEFIIGSHNYRDHVVSSSAIFQYLNGPRWQQVDSLSAGYLTTQYREHYAGAVIPVIVCSDINDLSTFVNKFGYLSTLCYNTTNEAKATSGTLYIASSSPAFVQDLMGLKPIELNPDPYEDGGGASTTGGGTGTFSETGDTVGIPSLPTLSAVDTGFITLFNPTAAQVKQLAAYMWSSGFDLDTFKNVVANPIDCILGLTIVPVDPTNAGTKTVTVGNIPTSVNMPYLSSQYVEVDCGSLSVQEFWGSYLDYSPYTKMSLYLPYIGIVPLDIDDVMNATIAIKYHVDVLSGACVAYVLCNGTQLYTYIGQCSSNVPITSNDFTNTVNGILGIAGNIGSLVSSGGNAGGIISAAANIASNAINAVKPNVQKSGAMSGTGGLMGVQTPYLICQRPRQSVPANQNTFTGYPSNITLKLGDLSGYTEVERIHLEGVPCTNEEMDEIMTLLESGVYI